MSPVRSRSVLAVLSVVSTITWVLTLFGEVWGGVDELVPGGDELNNRSPRGFRFTLMGLAPPPPPRLHVFMPINQAVAGRRFCRSYLSAVVNGYEPVLYNWDREGNNREMQKAKVAGLRDVLDSYLADAKGSDYILLADAMDIWFQLSPSFLVNRFNEMDAEVVIGADKMCWPNDLASPDCTNAPESPLPSWLYANSSEEFGAPRWANSGTVMGQLRHMRPLFRTLADMMDSPSYGSDNDQAAFNTLLSQGKLVVDPRSRMFWSSAFDTSSVLWMNTPYRPDDIPDRTTPWELYPALAHHRLTGEVPVLVHLNDVLSKHHLEDWWGKSWFSNPLPQFQEIVRHRVRHATLHVAAADGGMLEIPLEQVCRDHLDYW